MYNCLIHHQNSGSYYKISLPGLASPSCFYVIYTGSVYTKLRITLSKKIIHSSCSAADAHTFISRKVFCFCFQKFLLNSEDELMITLFILSFVIFLILILSEFIILYRNLIQCQVWGTFGHYYSGHIHTRTNVLHQILFTTNL